MADPYYKASDCPPQYVDEMALGWSDGATYMVIGKSAGDKLAWTDADGLWVNPTSISLLSPREKAILNYLRGKS